MPTQAPAAGAFDWTQRVGAVGYVELPKDSRGDWGSRAVLDDGSLVISLFSNRALSDAERSTFPYNLERFDPRSGERRTLTRMPPGSQAIFPIAANDRLAWVEVTDLRGYGWKLHLSNLNDGTDRIVASDPGIHPADVQSVIPKIALDGDTLAYTILTSRPGGELVWDVRRVGGQGEDTIATVSAKDYVIAISIDDESIAWVEDSGQIDPNKTATVGIYDRVKKSFSRIRTSMTNAVYRIAFKDRQMLFATGAGIFVSDRAISNLSKFSPESFSVDQLGVVGNYLVYRNSDPGQTIAAIDLTTREHARLASNATDGPYFASGRVIWFERPTNATPGRVAIVHL